MKRSVRRHYGGIREYCEQLNQDWVQQDQAINWLDPIGVMGFLRTLDIAKVFIGETVDCTRLAKKKNRDEARLGELNQLINQTEQSLNLDKQALQHLSREQASDEAGLEKEEAGVSPITT